MKIKNFIEYGSIDLFNIQWHYYLCEWHVSMLKYDYLDDERSFLSVGRKDRHVWFVDVFWVHLLPKEDRDES